LRQKKLKNSAFVTSLFALLFINATRFFGYLGGIGRVWQP